MDLDLRKLRYFVAVADSCSFRAAAQQLCIAQPALSRQIRSLESELGMTLFVRTAQGVVITPKGRRFLEEARTLLQSSSALLHRARQSGYHGRTFTVAFRPGIGISVLTRKIRKSHPDLLIDIVTTSMQDQADVVRDGQADVSFIRSPGRTGNIRPVRLFDESRTIVIAADHPLATAGRASPQQLARLGLLQSVAEVPELEGMELAPPTGSSRIRGGSYDSHTLERFEGVAAGLGVLVVPTSVAALYRRPDVSWIDLDQAVPSEVGLIHGAGNTDPLVREFIRMAVVEFASSMTDDAVAASG